MKSRALFRKDLYPKKVGKLSLDNIRTVVIDLAEQEIERPIKKQKSYYLSFDKVFPITKIGLYKI